MIMLNTEDVLRICRNELSATSGFEFYPFLVGWYNEKVVKQFKLDYPDDTLAVIALSLPCMFENTFLPWLFSNSSRLPELKDFVDECMQSVFDHLKDCFPEDVQIETIHDFEMVPGFRRPKILMTTAGHVSGAAYYHQMKLDVDNNIIQANNDNNTKFLGLSLHPYYGGWFAFRACLIFENICVPNLQRKEPIELLKTPDELLKTLQLFNYHWEDNRYRDVIPVLDRYSERQRDYFGTKPAERRNLIEKWLQNGTKRSTKNVSPSI